MTSSRNCICLSPAGERLFLFKTQCTSIDSQAIVADDKFTEGTIITLRRFLILTLLLGLSVGTFSFSVEPAEAQVTNSGTPEPLSKELVLRPGPENGKDTTLFENQKSRNNYKDSFLRVQTLFTNNNRRSLILEFDLSAVPKDAPITKAALYMYGDQPYAMATIGPNRVYTLGTTNWDHTKATWNSPNGVDAWATPGGVRSTEPRSGNAVMDYHAPGDGVVSADIGEHASFAQRTRNGRLILFIPEATGGFDVEGYFSANSDNVKLRPAVSITYTVPELPRPEKGCDVMFALDSSDSMGKKVEPDLQPKDLRTRFQAAKDAATLLANRFEGHNQVTTGPKVRLGLVTFDGKARLRTGLTDNMSHYKQELQKLKGLNHGTVIGFGLDIASDQLTSSESDRRKVIILLSDGQDYDPGGGDTWYGPNGGTRAVGRALNAKTKGIEIYSILVTSHWMDPGLMPTLATQVSNPNHYHTAGRYGYTLRYTSMEDVFLTIAANACGPLANSGPTLKFCVSDQNTNDPIAGAFVYPGAADAINSNPPVATTAADREGFGKDYLIAGADGCTNPNFINHSTLTKGASYTVKGTAGTYVEGSVSWSYAQVEGQRVDLSLTKQGGPNVSTISNVTKTATPNRLTGNATQTQVDISFTVSIVDNKPVTDVILDEKLSDYMQFAPGGTTATLMRPDGTQATIGLTPDPTRKKSLMALNSLTQPGIYSMRFLGAYTGPADDVSRPVDLFISGDCARPEESRQSAFIQFNKGDGTKGCHEIPAGSIQKAGGGGQRQLLIEADTLFGNSEIRLTPQLRISDTSLVVAGRGVSGNAGSTLIFDHNSLPTTGKLRWNALREGVKLTVNRYISTSTAKTWECPTGSLTVGAPGATTLLYMNTDQPSPLVPPSSSARTTEFTMWHLKNPNVSDTDANGCRLEFLGNVRIVGTGTLVNKGGQWLIHGDVMPEVRTPQRYALGYVGLQKAGLPDSGRVTLFDQSQVEGAIVYTDSVISLGQRDATIPDAATVEKTHRAAFIGQTIQFPVIANLRANITLAASRATNAFPPFIQTYLPKAEPAP